MKKIIAFLLAFGLASCQIASPASMNETPETSLPVPATETSPTVSQETRLFTGPGNAGYEILAELEPGDLVTPLGRYGDFIEVETGDGFIGYLWQNALGVLPDNLPDLSPAEVPWQSMDILASLYNARLIQDGDVYRIDNSASQEWFGMDFGPFTVASPFSITVQSGMQGEFAATLLYGSLPGNDEEIRPILIILPDGRLQFQDGRTYDTFERTIDLPADGTLVFEFEDVLGRVFDIRNEDGQLIDTIDLAADIPNLSQSAGLFPFGQVFIGLQTSPGSQLTLTRLSLAQVPEGRYDPFAEMQCSLSIGESEVVATRGQLTAHGLNYWPDTVMGVLRDGEVYTFLAGNSIEIGRTTGTLDDLTAGSVQPAIRLEDPLQRFDYASGGPVYRDPDGMLLMVYHAELWDEGVAENFTSSLGLASSQDNGNTWEDLGIIITPQMSGFGEYPFDVASGPIVARDGYFYIFFRDALSLSGQRLDVNMAVARAPVADVLAAARTGEVTSWNKYYRNGWNEPGLGGLSSPLETGNPATSVFDVKYNPVLGRYQSVGVVDDGGNMNLYYIESFDGLSWSLRQAVDESEGDKLYPTLIGLDASPQNLGESFYVYFVVTAEWYSENRWATANVLRRTITCLDFPE